ncbi:hypothetical protein [Gracilibacillus sp. JCM 18860]|uniref:hypothetical protein n=1 Tax=Gracilibacillus sp. JCM 18860 TaxID=1306159 RepID=UPI000A574C3F
MKKKKIVMLSVLGCAMVYSLLSNKPIDRKSFNKRKGGITRRKYIEIHRQPYQI